MPPVYESLLLNTAVPQIQAAQAGDSYVMVVNATTPALRITQTGTGNAISVEDEANPDATPFVVDASGNLGVGTTSVITGAKADIRGANANNLSDLDAQVLTVFDTTSYAQNVGGGIAFGYKFNSSNSYIQRAAIIKAVKENSTDGNYASAMVFATTANGASTTEKMRLDASGNLGLGVTPSVAYGKEFTFNSGTSTAGAGVKDLATNNGNSYYAFNARNSGAFTWNYHNSQAAVLYQQNGAGTPSHVWSIAPSGTAGDPITFIQAMTLDASGNLVVGATSTSYRMEVVAPSGDNVTALFRSGDSTAANNAGGGFRNVSSATATSRYAQVWLDADGANFSGGDYFYIQKNGNSGTVEFVQYSNAAMTFATNNTERARITSGGDVHIATGSSTPSSSVAGQRLGATGFIELSRGSGTTAWDAMSFINGNGVVGTINTNGSATAYNTSSDYRLKDNQQPLANSGAFIDALKPKTWNWKSDGSKGVGFIAHEVQEVSPGTVVGTKDAVDADGKPVMQAMEYGSAEFIANIVAELQSLRARVAQLEQGA